MKLTIDTDLKKPVVILGLSEDENITVSHFVSRDIGDIEIILNGIPGFVNSTLDAINEGFDQNTEISPKILADLKIHKTMLIIRRLLRNLVTQYGPDVMDEKIFGKGKSKSDDKTPDWVKDFLKGAQK